MKVDPFTQFLYEAFVYNAIGTNPNPTNHEETNPMNTNPTNHEETNPMNTNPTNHEETNSSNLSADHPAYLPAPRLVVSASLPQLSLRARELLALASYSSDVQRLDSRGRTLAASRDGLTVRRLLRRNPGRPTYEVSIMAVLGADVVEECCSPGYLAGERLSPGWGYLIDGAALRARCWELDEVSVDDLGDALLLLDHLTAGWDAQFQAALEAHSELVLRAHNLWKEAGERWRRLDAIIAD